MRVEFDHWGVIGVWKSIKEFVALIAIDVADHYLEVLVVHWKKRCLAFIYFYYCLLDRSFDYSVLDGIVSGHLGRVAHAFARLWRSVGTKFSLRAVRVSSAGPPLQELKN